MAARVPVQSHANEDRAPLLFSSGAPPRSMLARFVEPTEKQSILEQGVKWAAGIPLELVAEGLNWIIADGHASGMDAPDQKWISFQSVVTKCPDIEKNLAPRPINFSDTRVSRTILREPGGAIRWVTH